jgi:glycosyltransferase involved in cell wall biosynthesis
MKYRLRSYLFGKDRFRKLPGLPDNFTLIIPPPDLPINWLPRGRIYNHLRKYNQVKLERTIRLAIAEFSIGKYILFASFNTNYSLNFSQDIRPAYKIYQSVDNIAHARYLSKHGVYREVEVAREADLLLATSKEILNTFRKRGFFIEYVPNAANVKNFKRAYFGNTQPPDEFRAISRPIIGYIGSIDDRLDYELLTTVALRHHDKVIVLIGPMRASAPRFQSDNIIHIGLKPMSELPHYAKHMACAIIPFRSTEFTRSIYPLKINEYLGAGLPVVTTDFSDDIRDFQTVARITNDASEFANHIQDCIVSNTREKELERIAYAESNSWACRVADIWRLLETNLTS